jgi:hypothetical protein
MPETIGTARCVRVVEDSAFACVTEQGTTNNELFILWWDGLITPANPPARVRIAQSNWVALLREALASNIQVVITHDDNSSLVLNVQLGLEP